MKHILVLGAGQSAPYLIHWLLGQARANDWFITVADRDIKAASRHVQGHDRGLGIQLDITDSDMRRTQIAKADIVVNMMAPKFQHLIAWDCLNHSTHMVSVSYRDQTIRDLCPDAQRKGILILNEIGLDPGIDHMSSMSLIDKIRGQNGVITSFISYGSGIPAPESDQNPLKYVITWNPRNVVMAGEHGAQYLIDGKIKILPWHRVFQHSWPVYVEGLGRMEAYPNRDSLSYMKTFGLDEVSTMVRGTLRYPGWSETWLQIVRLGLPNETLRIPNLPQRSFREITEMFIPRHVSGATLESRVANYLNISQTGKIMENLSWLGLFDEQPCGVRGETSAEAMISLLQRKLPLGKDMQDMVVIVHEIIVRYPDRNDELEKTVSTLLYTGEKNGFTAMAKSVGLPAALAVKLLLTDELPLLGCHIPTHAAIYRPILRELEKAGFHFIEKSTPIVQDEVSST